MYIYSLEYITANRILLARLTHKTQPSEFDVKIQNYKSNLNVDMSSSFTALTSQTLEAPYL